MRIALPAGSLGGVGLIVLLVTLLLRVGGGFDVGQALEQFGSPSERGRQGAHHSRPPQRDLVDFLGLVVQDVQGTWQQEFADAGRRYEPTTLVLFEEATSTEYGSGSSATGPFYCPADGKMYLDLGFFRALRERFGASGDFAQAYVIAHEAGHQRERESLSINT